MPGGSGVKVEKTGVATVGPLVGTSVGGGMRVDVMTGRGVLLTAGVSVGPLVSVGSLVSVALGSAVASAVLVSVGTAVDSSVGVRLGSTASVGKLCGVDSAGWQAVSTTPAIQNRPIIVLRI